MIRISDILKKAKETKNKEEKPAQEAPLSKAISAQRGVPSPITPESVSLGNESKREASIHQETAEKFSEELKREHGEDEKHQASDISISSLLSKPASYEESEKLYQEMFSLARTAVGDPSSDYAAVDVSKLVVYIEKVVEQLTLSNEKPLMLAFLKDSADTNYLFSHAVNVCIYALEIGLAQGYSRLNLIELGVCAFLHDGSMAKFLFSAAHQPELNNEDRKDLKKYLIVISRIFSCINGFCNLPGDMLAQDTSLLDNVERFLSLKSESFSRYAKLISVVDFYEAMTHRGIYGSRHSSLEAVQEILNNKEKFEQGIIKVLIDRIGIFPVGSLIKLSTRETAQVIRLNRGKPLRPVVKILFDTQGNKLQGEKILDLSQHPTIYIKEEEKIDQNKVKG
jgi:HD-GYP domain-containing protein (c-di-GMP phosphodiesterase class II)